MNIKKVCVLGANGTMGSNVAAIFASFGNATVYLISRTKEKSEMAIEKAVKSVRADNIRDRLIPADYSELSKYISDADLVFESVAEDVNVKKNMLTMISDYVKDDVIICTGTSGLSINEMAISLNEKLQKRYLGMHMFNPPYNMTLCELIVSDYTDNVVLENIKTYAADVLYRTVVVSKDQAGFIGNRVGFFLINRAMQFADKYADRGGIDYIDTIMGGFTGRNMAPIATADFVGLDIHKAIVDNIYENTNDCGHENFVLPKYTQQLIGEGKLGRKSSEGFFKMVVVDGKKEKYVYDIVSDTYRKCEKYYFDFAQKMIMNIQEGLYEEAKNVLIYSNEEEANICKQLLVEYVLYALNVNVITGYTLHDADDAIATGFIWIPPLALIEWIGGKEAFVSLAQKVLTNEEYKNYVVDEKMLDVPKSKYDYKKFLKARG